MFRTVSTPSWFKQHKTTLDVQLPVGFWGVLHGSPVVPSVVPSKVQVSAAAADWRVDGSCARAAPPSWHGGCCANSAESPPIFGKWEKHGESQQHQQPDLWWCMMDTPVNPWFKLWPQESHLRMNLCVPACVLHTSGTSCLYLSSVGWLTMMRSRL